MASRKLRLFVWHGVLTDWTDGVAFALARSPEQAKELVVESGLEYDGYWNGLKLNGVEPTEYDGPFGTYLHGGG